jgi:hypothetical protein
MKNPVVAIALMTRSLRSTSITKSIRSTRRKRSIRSITRGARTANIAAKTAREEIAIVNTEGTVSTERDPVARRRDATRALHNRIHKILKGPPRFSRNRIGDLQETTSSIMEDRIRPQEDMKKANVVS